MKLSSILRGRGMALAALVACTTTSGAYAVAAPSSEAPEARTSVGIADTGAAKVGYGRSVRISGAVSPRTKGKTVRLEYATRGGNFRSLASSRTEAGGSYAFTPTARRSGSYRVVTQGAARSTAKHVTVVSALSGRATRHVLGGRSLRVKGTLKPGTPGRSVALQLASGGKWRTVDTTRTGSQGRFRASWRPRAAGVYRLRLRTNGDRLAAGAAERLAKVNAYRAGHASWYGPGLYGNHLGCGGRLSPGTLGVAHKTLPCGTKVTFRYRGRSVRVAVVDRGPYIAGREWDLTAATKQRLGFGSTGTVFTTR